MPERLQGMAFSTTVMLLSVRNLAEWPTRLYNICIKHHITPHHITSHHIGSHHTTSHHITPHHTISHHITQYHITVAASSHHTCLACHQTAAEQSYCTAVAQWAAILLGLVSCWPRLLQSMCSSTLVQQCPSCVQLATAR